MKIAFVNAIISATFIVSVIVASYYANKVKGGAGLLWIIVMGLLILASITATNIIRVMLTWMVN